MTAEVSWRDGHVWLDRADEHITITSAVLNALRERGWLGEGIFVIKAKNATARYALQGYDRALDAWSARRIGPDPLLTGVPS